MMHNINNFNITSLPSSEYPASLKYADITPIFEKDDRTDKTNYNLTSIPPFKRERFMQNQIYLHLNR